MFLFILIPISIILLAYYTYTLQPSYRNLPPGPFILPILGSVPAIWWRRPVLNFLTIRPWEYLDMLSKEFGGIFTCGVFNFYGVVLTSLDVFEEVANMEEYSYKYAYEPITYVRTYGKELGLILVYSKPLWTEMRKFTTRTLREFGFGKRYTMHSVITEEVDVLMAEFEQKIKLDEGLVTFRNTFTLSVLNVLWCMVAGTRYDHDDPTLLKLMDHIFKMSKSVTFGNPIELIIPFTRKIFPKLFNAHIRYKVYEEIHELTKSLVEERKAKGIYLTAPQNYIDVFLQKIQTCNADNKEIYTEEQLEIMLDDLLLVGSLTLNSTLAYAMLFLTIHPEIQKKCQSDIDAVVPRHLRPNIEDIEKMPYLQAFLLEVHRCANVVPNPIPRLVPNDWKFRDYSIPKGTLILSNHFTPNKDDKVWGDADTFRPERFINEKGEFVNDSRVIAFGFGKRICIGITLVNSVYPLFMAALLQKFSLSVAPGEETPTTEPEIGVSLSPKKFTAKMTVRPDPKSIIITNGKNAK